MVQNPDIEPSLTTTLTYKGHIFEICTKRGDMGKYLTLHNVVEISIDGLQVLFLTDTEAHFDTNKIDLCSLDGKGYKGWLNLNVLALMLKGK